MGEVYGGNHPTLLIITNNDDSMTIIYLLTVSPNNEKLYSNLHFNV